MRLASTISILALLAQPVLGAGSAKPPGKDAILLSNVKTLTLRAERMTTSRRVSPVQQLSCVGPSKKICDLYTPDTMRCTNDGYDYDEEDVQWTCTAPLPSEFKLGATDVICEGYRNSDDKWVLKGSCGVEYRLLLTEEGERRFGHIRDSDWSSRKSSGKDSDLASTIAALIFWGIFITVLLIICFPAIARRFGLGGGAGGRNPRRGFGGGYGGGGDGGYPPGPPPPYSRFASDGYSSYKSHRNEQSWRPGFWSGALGGAAAGYGMGRRSGNGGSRPSGYRNSDPGEGSSGTRSPQFSSTSSSTGFGSTRRR